MGDIRKKNSPERKLKVAIEAIAGEKTVAEIASIHKVHPTQVGQWKKQLNDSTLAVFGGKKVQSEISESLVSKRYEEV